jgi:hypothetical protein
MGGLFVMIRIMEKVGIKLANGKFYPILDENSSICKNLVLTTVRDGQTLAQIDFYLSGEARAGRLRHLGTLVVDNISRKYAAEADIALRLRAIGNRRVSVEAYEAVGADVGDGESQKLGIDLDALCADDAKYGGMCFDNGVDSGAEAAMVVVAAKERRVNPVVIALIILFVAAGMCLIHFLTRGCPLSANIGRGMPVGGGSAAVSMWFLPTESFKSTERKARI